MMQNNHIEQLKQFIMDYVADKDNCKDKCISVIREKFRNKLNEEVSKKVKPDDENSADDLANSDNLSTLEKLQNSIISDAVTFEDLQDDVFKLTKDGIKELSDIAVIDATKLIGGKTIYDYTDKVENLVYDYKSDEDGDGEPINEFFTAIKVKTEDDAVEKVFYVTQETGSITGVIEVTDNGDDEDDDEDEDKENEELSNDDSSTESSGSSDTTEMDNTSLDDTSTMDDTVSSDTDVKK